MCNGLRQRLKATMLGWGRNSLNLAFYPLAPASLPLMSIHVRLLDEAYHLIYLSLS